MTHDDSVDVNEKTASQTTSNDKTAQPVSETPETTVQIEPETTAQADSTGPSDSTNSTETPDLAASDTPSVEELSRQLADATQKADEHWDSLLRKQAEYDNLQKRTARDLEKARKYALEKFATDLLGVKDSMELGIEAAAKPETKLETVREGMELTLKMLADTLAKSDIGEIHPVNEKFNPQWHEAMAMQPSPDVEDGTVLHVHQKGYQLNDRLLRPARVVVAKAVNTEKTIENQG
jgi:molecular chaperone GrpE